MFLQNTIFASNSWKSHSQKQYHVRNRGTGINQDGGLGIVYSSIWTISTVFNQKGQQSKPFKPEFHLKFLSSHVAGTSFPGDPIELAAVVTCKVALA